MIKFERLSYKDLFYESGDPGTSEGKMKIKNHLVSAIPPFALNGGKIKKIF